MQMQIENCKLQIENCKLKSEDSYDSRFWRRTVIGLITCECPLLGIAYGDLQSAIQLRP